VHPRALEADSGIVDPNATVFESHTGALEAQP
jgi:hypothetical protein